MAIAKHKPRQRELREGRALARRVQRGDRKAFELLYASYEGGLFRFCHRLTRSDAAAAALVEATFVRALGTLPEGRLESLDIGAHLHATARTLAYERHANGGPPWPDPAGGGEHASEVAAASQRLAPRQRMTLALRDLERLTDDEIALALAAEARTVPALVARARLRLRAELHLPGELAGCREHLPALSAYADGTLPIDQRAELETHIEGCAACRAALFALQEAALRYRALPVPVPSGELSSRITVALGAVGLPARRVKVAVADPDGAGGGGRQTAAAAAMAVLAVLGVGVTIVAARDGGNEGEPSPAPVPPQQLPARPAEAALRTPAAAPANAMGGRVVRSAPPVRGGPARIVHPRPSRRHLPPPDAGAPASGSLRPFSAAAAAAPPPPPQAPSLPATTTPKPSRPIPVEIVPPVAPQHTPATADAPPPPPESPPASEPEQTTTA